MFKFIYAIGASIGRDLSPKQIKKIAKHIFNQGIEISKDTVREEIEKITA